MVQLAKSTLAALVVVGVQGCTIPAANTASVNLIKSYEGWEPNIYTDPSGNPTVGYGHLCSNSKCTDVPYHIPLSTADGLKLLASDLKPAETCITMKTADCVKLNANEYGALVSWAFNEGCGNVASSTLISRLNTCASPLPIIEQELPKWVYAGGVKLEGLVKRRAAEVSLAKTATSVGALPANC